MLKDGKGPPGAVMKTTTRPARARALRRRAARAREGPVERPRRPSQGAHRCGVGGPQTLESSPTSQQQQVALLKHPLIQFTIIARRPELERARDRARQADEIVDEFGVEAVELAAELLGADLLGFLVGFFPQSGTDNSHI